METALPFKKFLTEECFAQISNITNIAKESICEQYSKYYNHLQEEDKHAHSVVLVVNHHTVGPQGHQQIMVCALEREEEQRENVNISTICGINVVSLCQPVPPQNKCILIGTFFWTSFGAFSRETLVWRHLFLLKTNAWRGRSTFCCSQPLLFHLCTIKNWEPSCIKILKNPLHCCLFCS